MTDKNEIGRLSTALLRAEHGAGYGEGFNTRQRMAIAEVLAEELEKLRAELTPKPAAVIKPTRKTKPKKERASGDD